MWEGRSTWSYNTDLMMDLAMYIVDFAHHLHMLVRNYLKMEELSFDIHMDLSAVWVQGAAGV